MSKKSNEGQDKPRLLGFKDLVKEFGVTEWFWRARYWNRELQAVNCGRKLLFDRKDIEAFLEKKKGFA